MDRVGLYAPVALALNRKGSRPPSGGARWSDGKNKGLLFAKGPQRPLRPGKLRPGVECSSLYSAVKRRRTAFSGTSGSGGWIGNDGMEWAPWGSLRTGNSSRPTGSFHSLCSSNLLTYHTLSTSPPSTVISKGSVSHHYWHRGIDELTTQSLKLYSSEKSFNRVANLELEHFKQIHDEKNA